MRILIDPGTYNCLNLGDLAMLQVGIGRLRNLVPSATLQVITDAPDVLARHCANAQPVSAGAFRAWFQDDILLPRGQGYLPPFLALCLRKIKRYTRRYWPGLLRHFLLLARSGNVPRVDLKAFVEAVYSADCVVICGQGFLTDHIGNDAITKLNLLAAAEAKGILCAMLGQGFGPLTDMAILHSARAVLPGVEIISLREAVTGVQLCRAMHISNTKCLVSGDEAVELAYKRDGCTHANGVGINVRLSPSSGLDENALPLVGAALRTFAAGRSIQYVPLPIARDHSLRDVKSIRQLLRIVCHDSDGGIHLETPEALINEVSKCRIVLTGAYHAAVFALAQGIPAICICQSDYFRVKFEGLADQFGPGCIVIPLQSPQCVETLVRSLAWAWDAAPQLRLALQQAASKQIFKSYRVYNRLGRTLRRRIPGCDVRTLVPPKRDMRLVAASAEVGGL